MFVSRSRDGHHSVLRGSWQVSEKVLAASGVWAAALIQPYPSTKTLSTSSTFLLSDCPSAKDRLHLLQTCVTPLRPTLTSACQVRTRPPGCQNHLWSSSRPHLRIVRLPKENRKADLLFTSSLCCPYLLQPILRKKRSYFHPGILQRSLSDPHTTTRFMIGPVSKNNNKV